MELAQIAEHVDLSPQGIRTLFTEEERTNSFMTLPVQVKALLHDLDQSLAYESHKALVDTIYAISNLTWNIALERGLYPEEQWALFADMVSPVISLAVRELLGVQTF